MLLGGFPKAFRDLVSFFLLGVHNKAAFPDNDDDDDDQGGGLGVNVDEPQLVPLPSGT